MHERIKKNPIVPKFSDVLADIEQGTGDYNQEVHAQSLVQTSEQDDKEEPSPTQIIRRNFSVVVVLLLILVGGVAASLFVFIGIRGANQDQQDQFDRITNEVIHTAEIAIQDYVVAASYIQESSSWDDVTHGEFLRLYLNMKNTGLNSPMISHNPLVPHSNRSAAEESSRTYYTANYPHVDYQGIRGLEPLPGSNGAQSVQYRSEQPFYFPSQMIEPVYGNEDLIDFDLYSIPEIRSHIDRTIHAWEPTLTSRVGVDEASYAVILLHPGNAAYHQAVATSAALTQGGPGRTLQGQSSALNSVAESDQGNIATSFTAIQIQISDLLKRLQNLPTHDTLYVYLYCSASEMFLGGVEVSSSDDHIEHRHDSTITFQPEMSIDQLLNGRNSKAKMREYTYAPLSSDPDSTWTVYVLAAPGSYESKTTFIVLAGLLLFVLSLVLGAFIYANLVREDKLSKVEAKAQQEKAALVVQNAGKAAKRERDLNDFIAHEVRNPLAAAMSACSFVSSEVLDEKQPLVPPERYESVKEDIGIIESSLHFINDLLRNMLDMQRAGSKQLKISNAPTHVMNDILRPVDSMLHRRDANFEVILECDPENLIIMTDSLRLKQIVLNLARNAVKFVERGFIRIKATTVEDEYTNETLVQLSVEDSGPGIPEEKQKQLFGKFQESLDSLSQGTGIGLSLCKQLTKLMGAKLWIDPEYDSGLFECPGTRFVIDLNVPPMEWDDDLLEKYENESQGEKSTSVSSVEDVTDSTAECSKDTLPDTPSQEIINEDEKLDKPKEAASCNVSSAITHVKREELDLPEVLSVLFVDDDMVLRKLFSRSVRKVAPNWAVQEAGNGEAALGITKTESFDIIFMDQYMASVQKQLLGTEATRALRAQGVTSKICGLSANDVEKAFLEAGADSFMMKPFPCKPDALRKELIRVVNTDRNIDASKRSSGVSSVQVWVENVG